MGLLAFLKTQFVVHLLIGFVFVVRGLVINSIQLCTLVLWPVNKQLYRRLNCRLAYSLWSRECCLRWAWHGGGRGLGQGQPPFCWTTPNKPVQGSVGLVLVTMKQDGRGLHSRELGGLSWPRGMYAVLSLSPSLG